MSRVDTRVLMEGWRLHHDQAAAAEIIHRYLAKLVALARRYLSPELRRRLDPEDVAQAALGSFFRRLAADDLDLRDGVEPWSLLYGFVRRKALRTVDRDYQAKCRAVTAEEHFGSDDSLHALAPKAADPSPEEAIMLADELDRLFAGLSPEQAAVAGLWLRGFTLEESAGALGRSDRWVSRQRERICKAADRLGGPEDGDDGR